MLIFFLPEIFIVRYVIILIISINFVSVDELLFIEDKHCKDTVWNVVCGSTRSGDNTVLCVTFPARLYTSHGGKLPFWCSVFRGFRLYTLIAWDFFKLSSKYKKNDPARASNKLHFLSSLCEWTPPPKKKNVVFVVKQYTVHIFPNKYTGLK